MHRSYIFRSSFFPFVSPDGSTQWRAVRRAISLRGLVDYGEAALGGFFVEGGEVVAGLFHYFDNAVEADGVVSIGERRIKVGVQGSGGGIGVALNTRNLDKPAYRVASQPQMVFKTHFGGVFYLGRCAPEELRGGGRSHSTGYADFPLASHFGAGNGCIVFHYVSEKACSGKGAQNAFFREVLGRVKMVKYGRDNAA